MAQARLELGHKRVRAAPDFTRLPFWWVFLSRQMFPCRLRFVREFVLHFWFSLLFLILKCFNALSILFCRCMLSIFLFCSGTPITACGTSTSSIGTPNEISSFRSETFCVGLIIFRFFFLSGCLFSAPLPVFFELIVFAFCVFASLHYKRSIWSNILSFHVFVSVL